MSDFVRPLVRPESNFFAEVESPEIRQLLENMQAMLWRGCEPSDSG
jgi:hypothetical protein